MPNHCAWGATLVSSPESEHKVESALLLDVVVGEGSSVLQLLTSEDQPLLIRGDSLLVLDLSLDVLDGVRGLDLEGDGLTGEGLDEDLHTSSPSGCCSRRGFFRPPVACQRRSTSADRVECLPYPESWPSRSQWSPMARPRG